MFSAELLVSHSSDIKVSKATNEETKEMLKDVAEYTILVQSPAEIFEHLRVLVFSF